MQMLKKFFIANLHDKIGLNESINGIVKVMHFSIQAGLNVSPFELHYRRKLRTKLTNIVKDNKSFLPKWTSLNVLVPRKQIPINLAKKGKGEVTDHKVMATNKKIGFFEKKLEEIIGR